jgi:hypothetical protein
MKSKGNLNETDLYPPVKEFLEKQGYTVKGEVQDCDVVGIRDGDIVVVELKITANLKLLYQANDRKAMTDAVYIALPDDAVVLRRTQYSDFLKLIKRLGIGLLIVSPGSGLISAVEDPSEYTPRKLSKRKSKLLREFNELVGDPNDGGSNRRQGRMTAYRQKALGITTYLLENGPSKASSVRDALGNEKARDILYSNVYGWFEAHGKGIYSISPRGESESQLWLYRA